MGKIFIILYLLFINIYSFSEINSIPENDIKRAENYLKIGSEYLESNNFERAEKILLMGLDSTKNLKSKEAKLIEFELNIKLGEVLYKNGRGGKAIVFYSDGLMISRDLEKKDLEALALVSLARVYFLTGQYDLSLRESIKSLEISEAGGYYDLASLSAYFCGMANRNLKQFNNALEFFEKAILYAKKSGNKVRLINSLNEKGNVLFQTGKVDEALQVKQEALDLARKEKDKDSISNCLNDIALIYSERNKHIKAEKYFKESLRIAEEVRNSRSILLTLLNLARGQSILGKNNEARLNFNRALDISENLQYLEEKKVAKKLFSEFLLKEGNYQRAYKEISEAYDLLDKIFTEELARKISGIAYSYEIDKKQKEIEFVKKEKEIEKKQKKYFILAFIMSVFLIFLMGIILNLKIKTNKILEIAKKREEELARIDPLTSLSNRRHAYEKLEDEINRFKRSGVPFSIILLDLDNFKFINDTYGHNCGDLVLVEISKILKNTKRAIDTAARWGGEEFMLILPETNLIGATKVAERIKEKIFNLEINYKGKIVKISGTFGVVEYGEDLEKCLKKVDDALYEGKRQGKNIVIEVPRF